MNGPREWLHTNKGNCYVIAKKSLHRKFWRLRSGKKMLCSGGKTTFHY